MYDWIIETIQNVIKHGWSLAALGGAVFSLLKIRRIRKQLQRHLPPVFRDRDDERLDMIIDQNNEIIRRLGGEPWPNLNARQSEVWRPCSAQRKRLSFTFSWVGSTPARSARRFTNYQNGRVKKMKWLRPEFLVFVVGVLVFVLNEQFGWELKQESVVAFFVTVGGYLTQQGLVNIKRGADGAFAGMSVNSRKMILTLVGALLIGLNEVMQLGFDQDTIWGVAALITGYNALEGTLDAKTAIPTIRLYPSHGVREDDPTDDEQSH
jgi:hypothetical protein